MKKKEKSCIVLATLALNIRMFCIIMLIINFNSITAYSEQY